jgi:hypothetical protein
MFWAHKYLLKRIFATSAAFFPGFVCRYIRDKQSLGFTLFRQTFRELLFGTKYGSETFVGKKRNIMLLLLIVFLFVSSHL